MAEPFVLGRRKFLQDDPTQVVLRDKYAVVRNLGQCLRVRQCFARFLEDTRLDAIRVLHEARFLALGFVGNGDGFSQPLPFAVQRFSRATQLPACGGANEMADGDGQQYQAGGGRQNQCPVRLQLFRIHANTAAVSVRESVGPTTASHHRTETASNPCCKSGSG